MKEELLKLIWVTYCG